MGNKNNPPKNQKPPKSQKSKDKAKKKQQQYKKEQTQEISLAETVAEDEHTKKVPKHAPVVFSHLLNAKFRSAPAPRWVDTLWNEVERFLIHDSAAEMFLFLREMHTLKGLYAADPTDVGGAVKIQMTKIYDNYCTEQSKYQINLSSDGRYAFTGATSYAPVFMGGEPKYDWVGNNWVHTGTLTNPNNGIWAHTEGEVTRLMLNNKWDRFKKSEYYSQWLAMEHGGKAWIQAGKPTINFAQEEYDNYLDFDDSFDDVSSGYSSAHVFMNDYGYNYYNNEQQQLLGGYNGYDSSNNNNPTFAYSVLAISLAISLSMMICCGLVLLINFFCCAAGYVFGSYVFRKNKNKYNQINDVNHDIDHYQNHENQI